MLLALAFIIVGAYHILIVTESLMGQFTSSMDEWGLQSSCQGSVCHEEWRESFTSCEGLYRTTYRIRYLTIGICGLFFGIIGFQGALSRCQVSIKSFLSFWVAMLFLLIVLFIADEVYVEVCEVLPRNMQLDIQMFIDRGHWAMMNARGFKDLTNVKTDRIKDMVGFEWNVLYPSLYLIILVVMAILANEIRKYADNVDEGPVGLGANFVISNEPNREVMVMADRMNDAVQDYFSAVPHYSTIPQLEDGTRFPYFKKGKGPAPSINYGTMGTRPPPPQED